MMAPIKSEVRQIVTLLIPLVLVTASCERKTRVTLGGNNPPTFTLSGSGRLGELIIFAPEQEKVSDPFDTTHARWQIAAEKGGESGASLVDELKTVTYGVVPSGYKQVKPDSGAPQALVEGRRYRYWFVTVNAPHAGGYFEIRDGKAAKVSGP